MPPSDPSHNIHKKWMARCIALARRGQGHVSPNPLVGSVIIDENDNLLGEGWHEVYGGPHAEQNAVRNAIENHGESALHKATLYVNLEPCSHFGKTPPCSHLILDNKIPRVVIGMIDPYEKVQGKGIALLKGRGVEVCVGVLESACQRLNEAFSHHLMTGKPLVHLKIAQTLDGRIATTTGDSQWISGNASRKRVHEWRAKIDAVLIGHGTALADNPSLTVRHVSGRQPYRVVLDKKGTLPKNLNLFTDEHVAKTIAIVSSDGMTGNTVTSGRAPGYSAQLESAGGAIMCVSEKEGHLDLSEVFTKLGRSTNSRRGFQSLLIEAGPSLSTALFEQDLVDRLHLFIAPKLIGSGKPTLDGLSIEKMKEALTFQEIRWEAIGDDMLFQGFRTKY